MKNQTKWSIDVSHSQLAFKVKHLMISNIKGVFKTFEAVILTTGDDFSTAQIDVRIDTASLDTGDMKRDYHLKGQDFFDFRHHKHITFSGTNLVKSQSEGDMELWGNLTIKGISKQIKLIVEYGGMIKDLQGNKKVGFIITGKLNRKDWQLNWNTLLETGGFMVGDEVIINCEILVTKSLTKEIEKIYSLYKKEQVAQITY